MAIVRRLCARPGMSRCDLASAEGGPWTKCEWQREVSGFRQNAFNGFLALRIALFAAGRGEVRLRNFVYRALA